MFTKEKKCGCCQVMAGEKYTGSKFICDACRENSDLTDAFTWYRILWENQRAARVFVVVYPAFLLANVVMNGCKVVTIAASCIGLCALYLMRRDYLKKTIPVKMEKCRNEMFLLKLSGKTRE